MDADADGYVRKFLRENPDYKIEN